MSKYATFILSRIDLPLSTYTSMIIFQGVREIPTQSKAPDDSIIRRLSRFKIHNIYSDTLWRFHIQIFIEDSFSFAFLTGKITNREDISFGRKTQDFFEFLFNHKTGYIGIGFHIDAHIPNPMAFFNNNLVIGPIPGISIRACYYLGRKKLTPLTISISSTRPVIGASRRWVRPQAHLSRETIRVRSPVLKTNDRKGFPSQGSYH